MRCSRTGLVLLLAVGPLLGCSPRGASTVDFTKAVVERPVVKEGGPVFDPSGMVRMERRTVTDRDEVAKLASFFPGLGQGKESGIAGGWRGGYWVKFDRADGTSVHVTVDSDARVWSEGHGDWKAEPGLKEFLDRLLAAGDDQKDTAGR